MISAFAPIYRCNISPRLRFYLDGFVAVYDIHLCEHIDFVVSSWTQFHKVRCNRRASSRAAWWSLVPLGFHMQAPVTSLRQLATHTRSFRCGRRNVGLRRNRSLDRLTATKWGDLVGTLAIYMVHRLSSEGVADAPFQPHAQTRTLGAEAISIGQSNHSELKSAVSAWAWVTSPTSSNAGSLSPTAAISKARLSRRPWISRSWGDETLTAIRIGVLGFNPLTMSCSAICGAAARPI